MTVELVNYTFDICLNQERLAGWIRARGGCMRLGGKLGQGVGALKGGVWNPLTNYDISLTPKMVKKAIMTMICKRHLVLIVFQWWS